MTTYDSELYFLIQALAVLYVGWGIVWTLARGLPVLDETFRHLGNLVLTLMIPLRNLFNKDTKLANALKAKGIDPALADQAAELAADLIESALRPYVPETMNEVQ